MPKNTDAIRNQYSKLGTTGYYQAFGKEYKNPHFQEIRALLLQNAHRIDYSRVLDFCCGSGEVSLVLHEVGYPLPLASDPYTTEAYRSNFNQDCLPLSFEEVIRGHLKGQFSAIICSFAMHLCPKKQLFPLSYQLFQCSPQLVIITPHKRPELALLEGISLDFTDFTLTDRGKKVFLKSYRRLIDLY